LPIILIIISKYEDLDIAYEVIKAHEYWRAKGVFTDLVVVSQEEISYSHPLWNSICDVVASSHLGVLQNISGGAFLLRGEILSKEELTELINISSIVSCDGRFLLPESINREKMFNTVDYASNEKINKKELEFFNGIGGFDIKNNEYVIYPSKDNYTPLPWSNVLANSEFGCITTEAGGGFTWAFNSHEYRITPWSNDSVSDELGEYLYIKDLDNDEIFSPYLLPFNSVGEYEVTYGLGYTKYLAIVADFRIELTIFVPKKDLVKVLDFKIKNLKNRKRNIEVGYYIDPVLGFSNNFKEKTIEYRFDNGRLLLCNKYEKEFIDKKAFLVMNKDSKYEKKNVGFEVFNNISLEAFSEINDVVLLGVFESDEIIEKYRNKANRESELERIKEFYNKEVNKIKVKTPDKATNLLLNSFLLYQALVCRIWAKSSFFQSGGATGFRDQLQDSIPFSYILPDITREQILYHAKHQFSEGDVLHWWHKEARKGTRTKFSDDLLWLVFVINNYIKVTGDSDILKEQIEFSNGPELEEYEDEKYIEFEYSKNYASLFAHCIFAIEHAIKLGDHGLILMGAGDWNDGMNEVGNKGKGESVWLSWFVYKILTDFSPICKNQGRDDLADKYSEFAGKIKESINTNAWDGEWYKRAFFDDGTPLGSIENEECKIDSISQSWSVISGAGEANKVKKAMTAFSNYLIDKENGIIKLLTPAFSKSELKPGYIKSYPEGVRENGGQYTHAAVWAGIAYALLDEGEKTFEIFEMLNPINHSRTDTEMKKYKLEPYVISADIYSNPLHLGRGGWSWYTGAASWMYRFGIEFLLGLKFRENMIFIKPCIPSSWKEFEVEYRYFSSLYKIKVLINGEGKIVFDNIISNGNGFKLNDDGGVHFVEVRY